MLFTRSKPASHEARILAYLKKNKHGAYNYELAKSSVGGLAWHRRITDLRKDGVNITAVRISKGVFKYFYDGE